MSSHQLGDYLIVHGFDAIAEAVDALTQRNAGKRNRQYHWIAAGAVDEEGAFYFNPANPTASSMYRHGESRFDTIGEQEVRKAQVRRLARPLRVRTVWALGAAAGASSARNGGIGLSFRLPSPAAV